jgi:hypothetical protein
MEENGENADDDDEDGFFVPHGYLSDGEGCEEDDDVSTSRLYQNFWLCLPLESS